MVVGRTPLATEVLVVGGGPAGYAAAFTAAALGRRTLLVERGALGGVCLHTGCIPSKVYLEAAERLAALRRLPLLGAPPALDVARLGDTKARVVRELAARLEGLARRKGVDLLLGEARLTGPGSALVQGPDGAYAVRFDDVVLATGSKAGTLPGDAPDGERILLARDVFRLKRLPERLLVVGAGMIGVELGQALARFGAGVTLIERAARIVPMFDDDVGATLAKRLTAEGVAILCGHEALAVRRDGEAVVVRVRRPDGEEADLSGSHALLAVGRRAAVAELGLETVGLVPEEGGLPVDDRQRTRVPHVYAAGDLTPGPMVAPRAAAGGAAAAEAIAGRPGAAPEVVPIVLYSSPGAAQVGLSRREAEERGMAVEEVRLPLAALGRAVAAGEAEGFARLVVARGRKTVLGGTVVAPQAGEVAASLTLALEMGATLEDLAFAAPPHPTFAEAWHEAALAALGLGRHL